MSESRPPQQGALDVSIIIISYNTIDLTLDCLRSLYRETRDLSFEVIVIDNASQDGSAEAIAKGFPQVQLEARDENLGFGGACNYAAERALGDYILMLNPDVVVLDSAIQRLVRFARAHPDAQLYGGRTLWGDRSLNPTSCWREPSPWSVFCRTTGLAVVFRGSDLFDPESYGPWQRDDVREIDIVTGCLMLIDRRLWRELEGFDPIFFQRGEDFDFSMRAKRAGYRALHCPDATIIHYGGKSEVDLPAKISRNLLAKQLGYDRFWSPPSARFGRLMQELWVLRGWFAWKILGWLGRESGRQKSEMFREVWRRRDDWNGRSPQGAKDKPAVAGGPSIREPAIRWSGNVRPAGVQSHENPAEVVEFLPAGDAQLYSVRHPAVAPLRGRVLLAGTFPSQRLYSFIAWVSWARLLASNGYEVMRFDYRGTGESTGRFEDMTLEVWREDLRICLDQLDQKDGVPLLLHGHLMGGLLASHCFDESRADALLLWEPVVSAQKMLKEMLRGKLSEDMVLAQSEERKTRQTYIDDMLLGNTVEVDGYPWTRSLWENAKEMTLTRPEPGSERPWLEIRLVRNKKQRSQESRTEWKIPIVYPPFWADNQYMVPDLIDLFSQSLLGVDALIERSNG